MLTYDTRPPRRCFRVSRYDFFFLDYIYIYIKIHPWYTIGED